MIGSPKSLLAKISAKLRGHNEQIVCRVSMAGLWSSAKAWQDYEDWQALAVPIFSHSQ